MKVLKKVFSGDFNAIFLQLKKCVLSLSSTILHGTLEILHRPPVKLPVFV